MAVASTRSDRHCYNSLYSGKPYAKRSIKDRDKSTVGCSGL